MDNTRNHQTADNKNEQPNGKQNNSDELSAETEQEIPEALKNFDRDSVKFNSGELVYSKNDLFTIRDKAGNEVYTRPGNLSSVFCKDEPGNLINTFRIVGTNGESHKSEGQEQKVRRPPPGLPATPNASVRPPPGLPPLNPKSPHQSQQQSQQQQRYREGYNNSPKNNNSEYGSNNNMNNNTGRGERGERQGRRGYNNNNTSTHNSEEQNTNEEESIILSPPRKTFPSSQSTNNQRGNNNNNKHTAPPPGFNSKNNNNNNSNSNNHNNNNQNTNNNANSYVPPNRRQTRGDSFEAEHQQYRMRYQLKRASVEANATPNAVPNNSHNASINNNSGANSTPSTQNYIDDFLFGIGKEDGGTNSSSGGYNWDTFAKFNTSITLEDEEELIDESLLENDNVESKFSFVSSSNNNNNNNNTITSTSGSNDNYSSPIRNSSSSESTATPTSSRAFGRWFNVENTTSPVSTPIKSHTPPTTDNIEYNTNDNISNNNIKSTIVETPNTTPAPITVAPSIIPTSTTTVPVYMDPVAESESASFITSLLSKATLQERNSGNNVSNFGQMPPQNLPMHHPPHHLPHHMLHNPQMNPYLAHPQGLPPPHGFMNMGVPPNMNGPHMPQFMAMGRGGMPPPSPQQQQVPNPMDQRAGLEKWFGQNIYNPGYTNNNTYQAGPLPPNTRMLSLEELERNQPHVSQSSK